MSSPGPAGSSPGSAESDVRRPRRLVGKEEWFWYLLAAVTYIGAGIWQKFLLNWFVGPGWLVAFVVFGPMAWDRLRGRRSDSGDSAP